MNSVPWNRSTASGHNRRHGFPSLGPTHLETGERGDALEAPQKSAETLEEVNITTLLKANSIMFIANYGGSSEYDYRWLEQRIRASDISREGPTWFTRNAGF